MSVIGNLVANVSADTSGFTKAIEGVRGDLKRFVSETQSAGGSGGLLAGLLGGAGVGVAMAAIGGVKSALSGVVSGLTGVAAESVRAAADFEQTKISFEVMTGSAETASKLLGDIRQFAAKTPLETGDLTDAAKTLMQFGIATDNVLPSLRMLGDISGGNADRFKSLSLVFGQMAATGRLMGQDLLQMVNAGFNPLQTISEKTGESMVALKKRMENGKVSFNEVVGAMQSATGEGGRFFGMMDRQSTTVLGKLSTLTDNAKLSMIDLGESITTAFDLSGLIDSMGAITGRLTSEFMPAIKGSIQFAGDSFRELWRFAADGASSAMAAITGTVDTTFRVDLAASVGAFFKTFDLQLQVLSARFKLAAADATRLFTGPLAALQTGNIRGALNSVMNFKATELPAGMMAPLQKEMINRLVKPVAAAPGLTIPDFKLGAAEIAPDITKKAKEAKTKAETKPKIENQGTGLALLGSREALSNVYAAMRTATGAGKKPEDKTAENTGKMVVKLSEVAGLMKKSKDQMMVQVEF